MNYFPPYLEHRFGIFRCPHCRKVWTSLHDTIFRKSCISCVQFMTLALSWRLKDSNKGQTQSTNISNRSVSTFTLKMNAFADATLKRQKQKLWGLMHVVEIDEALLHRRRNGRGRLKKELWVLGRVERPRKKGDIPKVFFEVLPNRHRQTINPLIRKHIHRGSIICSDCFTSYRKLQDMDYYHFVVNHEYRFIDGPTHAHTQRIEGLWS